MQPPIEMKSNTKLGCGWGDVDLMILMSTVCDWGNVCVVLMSVVCDWSHGGDCMCVVVYAGIAGVFFPLLSFIPSFLLSFIYTWDYFTTSIICVHSSAINTVV